MLRLEEMQVLCAWYRDGMPRELLQEVVLLRLVLGKTRAVLRHWQEAIAAIWTNRFDAVFEHFLWGWGWTFLPQAAIRLKREVVASIEECRVWYCDNTRYTFYSMYVWFSAERDRDRQRMRDRTLNALPSWVRCCVKRCQDGLSLSGWVGPDSRHHNRLEGLCGKWHGQCACHHRVKHPDDALRLYECVRRHNGCRVASDTCNGLCLVEV